MRLNFGSIVWDFAAFGLFLLSAAGEQSVVFSAFCAAAADVSSVRGLCVPHVRARSLRTLGFA